MPARVGDPGRRKASAWVMASLAALGVLAVIALVAGLLAQRNRDEATVAVPPLVGLTQVAAQAQVKSAGLTSTLTTVKNDAVPAFARVSIMMRIPSRPDSQGITL